MSNSSGLHILHKQFLLGFLVSIWLYSLTERDVEDHFSKHLPLNKRKRAHLLRDKVTS